MLDLVLLRHGQSTWNAENLFTGWTDVDLTAKGELEAAASGRLLAEASDLDLRILHTSVLIRAIRTANLALDAAERAWIPVRRDWRLNERHYGDLQGKDKKAVAAQYGDTQLKAWRRGYDTPPPPLPEGDTRDAGLDTRYRDLSPDLIPTTECLADVVKRVVPYFKEAIVPDLIEVGNHGGAVLVVAHGNSLRALRKHLEHVSNEDITGMEIPTGFPFRYRLNADLTIEYAEFLGDPEALKSATEAVRRQAG